MWSEFHAAHLRSVPIHLSHIRKTPRLPADVFRFACNGRSFFPGAFNSTNAHFPPGSRDETVRHPIETGRHELYRHAAPALCLFYQSLFNYTFSQNLISVSLCCFHFQKHLFSHMRIYGCIRVLLYLFSFIKYKWKHWKQHRHSPFAC